MLDVIRCDEEQYLVWKWRPSGDATSTRKENAIRWGSSLRVKAGEVAVFVYKQENGPNLDFIEGPFDDTIKSANFPVLANIIGMAFAGQSPFQAEVYFINLIGNIKVNFRTPYFDVFDPRFADFPVRLVAGGSYRFNITDYKGFITLHRLINFEIGQFSDTVRDAVLKQVKGIVANAPADNSIPVLQLERKLLDINNLISPHVRRAFEEEFGVNLQSFDLTTLEVDKETEEYRQLRSVTADLEIAMRQKQNEINIRNLEDTQAINAENMGETLRIQREQAERLAALQTQQQFLGAHQINQQTAVLSAAANNLGAMGQMNLGTGNGEGGGSGGSFNPVGVMAGLAIGGAMGNQMGNMMNTMGQNIQSPSMMPPPPPIVAYHVAINGQNTGPFNMGQLQQMVVGGQLQPASHVWKAGMANWELAGNVAELAPLFIQAAPPPPPMPPVPPQAN
ncbi:SPFH domain-containing protein [Propionivibrio limicola]|uniref:SPFH domain-containing protein n=1 Tax=Propionivibrio limicola TaxID=167645 RepID=UPI001B87B723|nr:SPFH domain-containing protein [Propionivibrio limicola]